MSEPRTSRAGFTLIEIMVVITVVILLAIIALPAFTAMINSQQRVAAEENLKRATALGHNLALRASIGRDVAMVFFYEPPGPMLVVPCAKVAELDDVDRRDPGTANAQNQPLVRREVFVPIAGAEPVALPLGWHVRGYALPATVDNEWYEPFDGPGGAPRYNLNPADPGFGQGVWVFPETGLYDVNMNSGGGRDGQNRQTFMIRYEGGTGQMTMANMNAAILVSPRPSSFNGTQARGEPDNLRADLAQDLERFVNRILVTVDFNADGMVDITDQQAVRRLLGDESGDTILMKPVSTLALYNERELAAGIGVNIDRRTGCVYAYNAPDAATRPPPDPVRPSYPQFLPGVSTQLVNAWIEGQLGALPQAKAFTVDRFTGQSKPVSLLPGGTP